VALSTELYRQGESDFLNVLVAQRALYGSEDNLVQSDRRVAQNLVQLYRALGGGWEEGDGESPNDRQNPKPETRMTNQ